MTDIIRPRILSSFVLDAREIDQSRILWPLTRRGNRLLAGACFLLFGALLVAAEVCDNAPSCSRPAWSSIDEPRSSSDHCEAVHEDRLMGDHINSISNLGFALVGTVAWACGLADYVLYMDQGQARRGPRALWRNHLVRWPGFSFFYGLSCWFLAAGSWFFHARRSRTSQQLDVGGIFAVLVAPVFYGPLLFVDVRLAASKLRVIHAVLLAGMVAADAALIYYKWHLSTSDVLNAFIAILLVWVILLLVARKTGSCCGLDRMRACLYPGQRGWQLRGYWLVPLAVLFYVLGRWVLDVGQQKTYCYPNSVFQFHALWHVLCAAALMLVYFILRSEFITFEDEAAKPHDDEDVRVGDAEMELKQNSDQ